MYMCVYIYIYTHIYTYTHIHTYIILFTLPFCVGLMPLFRHSERKGALVEQ